MLPYLCQGTVGYNLSLLTTENIRKKCRTTLQIFFLTGPWPVIAHRSKGTMSGGWAHVRPPLARFSTACTRHSHSSHISPMPVDSVVEALRWRLFRAFKFMFLPRE